MKIFFIKAFVFIVGLSVIFNVLGSLADRVAPLEDWPVEYQYRAARLEARSTHIQAITLGSSHADSIDYPLLGMEGQSMALAAADLFEIEKIVITLENKLPNLNTVFITISPYSFSRDNAKFDALRPRRIGFYSIVPVWSPIAGDLPNFLMGKVDAYTHILSVVRSDSWKGVWPRLSTNTSLTDPFPYNGVVTSTVWGQCSHYSVKQLEAHALEIAGRNVTSSMQMQASHPGLEQDSLAALARTIQRLQSRGIRVVLYTPPYYEKYNLYFAKNGIDITEHMRRTTNELQEKYGVEYYDFSEDPELSSQVELFYNSDHVNECGAKAMTAKLMEKMEKNGQIDK